MQQTIKSDFQLTTDTHSSPSRASYGVSIMGISEKIDRVVTASPYNAHSE